MLGRLVTAVVQALTDAPGYSTTPTTDPESGDAVVGLATDWCGPEPGFVTSFHDSKSDARREGWRRDALRREGDARRARGFKD